MKVGRWIQKDTDWKKDDAWVEEYQEQQCLHQQCPECHGTGRKKNGASCVHMISCPCPRCTPSM